MGPSEGWERSRETLRAPQMLPEVTATPTAVKAWSRNQGGFVGTTRKKVPGPLGKALSGGMAERPPEVLNLTMTPQPPFS